MKLTTFFVVAGLALTSTATVHSLAADSTFGPAAIVSYQIPGTDYRGIDAAQPEQPEPPNWDDTLDDDALDETGDDTADTSDELERELQEEDLDAHSEIHFERDLNNDVHAPLFEDSSVDPLERPPVDPFRSDPLP